MVGEKIEKKDILTPEQIRAEHLQDTKKPKHFTPKEFAEYLKAYDPAALFLDPIRVQKRHKSLRMQMRRLKRLMDHPIFKEIRDKHKEELQNMFWATLAHSVDRMLADSKPNIKGLQMLGELAGALQSPGKAEVNVNINDTSKAKEQFNKISQEALKNRLERENKN